MNAPSHPGTTATEGEAREIGKCRELTDNGYISRPETMEVQSSLCEIGQIFITHLCEMLCCWHDDNNELAAFWSDGFQWLFTSAMLLVF